MTQYSNHFNQFIGKPKVDTTNITLWVTGNSELNFSIKIIAYPEPKYDLEYGNRTRNSPMINIITRSAVNNFTIFFHQKTVKECDYGTYHLKIWNFYGITTIIVNVFKQSKLNKCKLWIKITLI